MNKKQKFEIFLESLKGSGQDVLIESVKSGFQACFENEMEELSLEDKLGIMWDLGNNMAIDFEKNGDKERQLTEDESDDVWGVADGLIHKFVMKHVEGRTSLQDKLDSNRISLTVSGKLTDGAIFQGTDEIMVIGEILAKN